MLTEPTEEQIGTIHLTAHYEEGSHKLVALSVRSAPLYCRITWDLLQADAQDADAPMFWFDQNGHLRIRHTELVYRCIRIDQQGLVVKRVGKFITG